MPPVYLLVGLLTALPVRLVFRLRWRGLEHVPRSGGAVLAANHISNLDPWAIGIPLFPRRPLRFMAKSELFWFPLGLIIRGAGAFRVRRGQNDAEAIEHAAELCRQGELVMMFPEGTRRRKGLRKKWQPRARTGAARIALDAGVPLVPAAIAGTDAITRLGPLRVAYGAPIALDDLYDRDPRDAAQEATDRLMAAIRELEATLR